VTSNGLVTTLGTWAAEHWSDENDTNNRN